MFLHLTFFFFFYLRFFSYKTIYILKVWCFSCLHQWNLEEWLRWMRQTFKMGFMQRFFFIEIDFFSFSFLKETAVKWCIAFVYLCNIVHVYFFYLCYCLWITEPCPWISDSLISIYSKWKILKFPRWYCFWFVSYCFFPLPSL